jgi:hypothetical protein
MRARHLQQEKAKLTEELKTLRTAGGDKSEAPALKLKISELENELVTVRKTLAENSVELTRLKAQNSMAQNKSNRLQKEVEALKAAKASTSTLSANAVPFQASTPTNTASPVSSPVIASPQLNKIASSPVRAKNKQPATFVINTPDLSTTSVPVSVDTPVLTPAPIATLPPTNIVEPEVNNAETPVEATGIDTDTNITDDLNAPVPEPVSTSTPSAAAEVDADLSMDDDNTTNDQLAQDISENINIADESNGNSETNITTEVTESVTEVENNNELEEDTPVDVEVHEIPSEKAESPKLEVTEENVEVTIESTDITEETEEGEVEGKSVVESIEPTEEAKEELLEPAVGSKRKDRADEDPEETENATPGSPSKKLHTSTDE